MHRAGLAGITWSEAYGGHGLTLREHLIANQEIGRLALPLTVHIAAPMVISDHVRRQGGIHHQLANPVAFRLLLA